MNNNNLLLYGAIAVGAIFLYNRYTKKPQGQEEQGGGGGGGVGPIGPMPPLPPIAPILNINQGRSYTASEVTKSKNTTPTPASTSSTSVGAMSGVGVSNTGGIVPIGQGGSPTPIRQTGSVVQISQADLNKGISGGMVFKPFDGDMGGLRLENLVRSWNRP
jgi:hypothetical protein